MHLIMQKKSIKISQQALFIKGYLGFPKRNVLHPLQTIDGTVMEALANAINNKVHVYIVTSSLTSQLCCYSSHVNLQYISNYLFNLLKTQNKLSSKKAKAKLEKYLHLAYIAYSTNEPSNSSHNKIWIIDNKIFYIGSHNIYPSSLQQFGLIIESKSAAKTMIKQWWDPLWANASKQAVTISSSISPSDQQGN